jgi:hypothetical protein
MIFADETSRSIAGLVIVFMAQPPCQAHTMLTALRVVWFSNAPIGISFVQRKSTGVPIEVSWPENIYTICPEHDPLFKEFTCERA